MSSFIRVPAGAVVLTASMALAGSTARAADVEVKVPFSFIVSGQTLPPGDYRVDVATEQGLMEIRGVNTGVFALSNHVSVADDAQPKLVFHRYGDSYVLREVWTGDGIEDQIPEPKSEKALEESARQTGSTDTISEVVIAAD
jgi:hypothetical protein